jgi:hypothetical protein
MKRISIVSVFVGVLAISHAETFVGITSATNRLVVGTNEAIIISKFYCPPTNSRSFQLVKDGVIFESSSEGITIRISPMNPSALAGPCELITTNQSIIHFQRIATSSVQTAILLPSASTNTSTVSVPSGRTLKIFLPFPPRLNGWLRLNRGTNSVHFYPGGSVNGDSTEEFTGPLDVTFIGPLTGTDCGVFSFVMTDEPQVVPQGVTVQSPTGAFQFLVEKSVDLTNWVPSVIQNLQGNQKAYYRLRITK